MAKKEPEIIVTTVFDGKASAKDAFADLIIQKFLRDREQNYFGTSKILCPIFFISTATR